MSHVGTPIYVETQYSVVKHVAKKLKWNLLLEPVGNLNFDICWMDGHIRQDLFARMQNHQKVNHFPGSTLITQVWASSPARTTLAKISCSSERNLPPNISFFPSPGTYPSNTQTYKPTMSADNKAKHKPSSWSQKPAAKVAEYFSPGTSIVQE